MTCINLFVKAPVAGTVKSRLAEALDSGAVLALYRAFVADIMEKINSVEADLRIYFDPPDSGQLIADWLGSERVLSPQAGNDLGERMAAALTESLDAGHEKAILIGSDLPDLPASIVTEAMDALDRFPAVLGPSTDGGYYLIGFRGDGFAGDIFSGVQWSTDQVFAQTMQRFERLEMPVYVLPPWHDIDTYDDLKALIIRVQHVPNSMPHTKTALTEWGLMQE